MKTLLAVVDSYNLLRCALSHQLNGIGFSVIIEAENGADFMTKVKNAGIPQVCILDIDTDEINEFTTAKLIKAKYPDIKILAYTVYERDYKKIDNFGIDVFMPKNMSIEKLKSKILSLV